MWLEFDDLDPLTKNPRFKVTDAKVEIFLTDNFQIQLVNKKILTPFITYFLDMFKGTFNRMIHKMLKEKIQDSLNSAIAQQMKEEYPVIDSN